MIMSGLIVFVTVVLGLLTLLGVRFGIRWEGDEGAPEHWSIPVLYPFLVVLALNLWYHMS